MRCFEIDTYIRLTMVTINDKFYNVKERLIIYYDKRRKEMQERRLMYT